MGLYLGGKTLQCVTWCCLVCRGRNISTILSSQVLQQALHSWNLAHIDGHQLPGCDVARLSK